MAKLRDLIATTAHLLGDSEASINVLAIQLRRADLIRKEGRGLNAADMSAADAAALLTSAMAGGLATETAETTARVLNCDNVVRPSGIEHPAGAKLSRPSRELHPWVQTFDRPHTFGEAFTGLFEYYIAGEFPEPKHEIAGAIISVERTAAFYECKIFLSTGVGRETLTYFGPTLKGAELPRAEVTSFHNKLLDRYGRKSTTVSIDHIVLSEIANLLRGESEAPAPADAEEG